MPYWNFEYTKAVIYTVVKVGGGIGQDPATEVTHLRLNQPPVFSSACIQAMSHHTVHHITVSCHMHDTLHHCLSSNNNPENGDRELEHFCCYLETL